jgi:hypothetical protein
MAVDAARERLQLRLLLGQASRVVGGRVAPVQADLATLVEDRLDEAGADLVVRRRRRAVVRVVVAGEHEEGRAGGTVPALLAEDLREAPVRIGAAQAVDRRGRERARLAQRRREPSLQGVPLHPGRRTAYADARPAPRRVDIVGQRDGKALVANSEVSPQPLERRVERIEAGPLGAEATVLVTRPVPLLDAGEVVEARREVVVGRQLAALDLLPGVGVVGKVVAEPDVRGADRVEHPACAALDALRDHGNALRATRARWTSPGFGSSSANTASTYGGRCGAGASPGRSVIAQRFPWPFMRASGAGSPVRSA